MTRFPSLFTKSFFALLIAAGMFATNLQAQSDAITVSVPFPFTVGSQSIAPGTYQFSLDPSHLGSIGFLLSIANAKTGVLEVFNVLPERQYRIEERGRLTFRNSAGRAILTTVHFPGTDTFSEVIQRHRAGKSETVPPSPSRFVSAARPCNCTAQTGEAPHSAPRASLTPSTCTHSK